MGDEVRVALYGVLPPLAVSLFLVGRFGPRCLGLAAGVGLLAAFALLKHWPLWPHELFLGNNDGPQWLCWCVLLAGILAVGTGRRSMPIWAAVPLGAAAFAGQVWLMLTNRRHQWSADEAWLQQGAAAAAFVAVWLLVRKCIADRGSATLAAVLAGCLGVDAALLVGTHSGLPGQLAGAVAAAFGGAVVASLWRHSLRLEPPLAFAFAAAHCGLLLAGVQFSMLPPQPALLAAMAPAALALVGPPSVYGGDAMVSWRLALGGLLAAGLLTWALLLVFGGVA